MPSDLVERVVAALEAAWREQLLANPPTDVVMREVVAPVAIAAVLDEAAQAFERMRPDDLSPTGVARRLRAMAKETP